MSTIPIKYVGKKDEETDHLYGTNITWKQGETHDVPVEKAPFLLNHPDMWKDARSAATRKKEPVDPEQAPRAYLKEEAPPAINLPQMNEDGLRQYAKVQFNEEFQEGMKLDEMRVKVADLIRSRE